MCANFWREWRIGNEENNVEKLVVTREARRLHSGETTNGDTTYGNDSSCTTGEVFPEGNSGGGTKEGKEGLLTALTPNAAGTTCLFSINSPEVS